MKQRPKTDYYKNLTNKNNPVFNHEKENLTHDVALRFFGGSRQFIRNVFS